ncbi:MAG: helix-turn-helix domain-containing protein [Lachnospiraceae bacterium]|nr:helix-turn-helix domain-containing protein [Lachnospiraceae bacterium]
MQLKLADNIKRYRKQMNLTQEELSEHLGVTIGAVSKWENSNNVPDILMLMDIANFFNVSVDELLGYEMTSKNQEDLVTSIDTLCNERKFEEALDESRKALARYPHNFKIIYVAANAHYYSVYEGHNLTDPSTAIELYKKALAYISQNSDPDISEFSIKHKICEMYSKFDKEKALEGFKEINYDGVTNPLIAQLLSDMGRRDEALTYHTYSLLRCFSETYTTLTNSAACLAKSGKASDINTAIEMLNSALTIIDTFTKKDKVNYTFKFTIPTLFIKGFLYELLGEEEVMKEYIKKSYEAAVLYDKSKVESELSKSLKYFFIEKKVYGFDNVGTTALEGVESLFKSEIKELSGKLKEGMQKAIDYWNSLKTKF